MKNNGQIKKNEDKNEKNGNFFFNILLITSYKKMKKMKKLREKIQNLKNRKN